MRPILYLIYFILPAFIIGFVSGFEYLDRQDRYQMWYDTWNREWYKEWACWIVKSITGRKNCEIKEIQTASGKSIRAAISLPE